jgi:hypothetical protein
MRRQAVAAGLVAATMFGCGPRAGTDVGNGATSTFDVGAYKSGLTPKSHPVPFADGVVVTEAWLSVGEFRLLPGAGCGNSDLDGPLALEGPITADLTHEDAASGRSEEVEVQAGAYCQLRAEVEPVDEPGSLPDDAPAELVGAALFVRGVRADGVPFTVRSTRGITLRLDAPDQAPFNLAGENALVVAFDLEAAVAALELDALEGPSIAIDENAEPQRLTGLEGSLREGARLFRDLDADGVLSADEAEPGRALAVGRP